MLVLEMLHLWLGRPFFPEPPGGAGMEGHVGITGSPSAARVRACLPGMR